jgi:hypothetical protein
MAKACVVEKHSLSIDGILDTTKMTVDCEDLGERALRDLLVRFNGEHVKLSINLTSEIN